MRATDLISEGTVITMSNHLILRHSTRLLAGSHSSLKKCKCKMDDREWLVGKRDPLLIIKYRLRGNLTYIRNSNKGTMSVIPWWFSMLIKAIWQPPQTPKMDMVKTKSPFSKLTLSPLLNGRSTLKGLNRVKSVTTTPLYSSSKPQRLKLRKHPWAPPLTPETIPSRMQAVEGGLLSAKRTKELPIIISWSRIKVCRLC